jgi:hypothetical protein
MKKFTIDILNDLKLIKFNNARIDFLKNKFKDKKCVVISAGPSVSEIDILKLKKIHEDCFFIAIKQTYNLLEDDCDIHFNNIYNYSPYNYKNTPLTVTTTPINWRKKYFEEGVIKFYLEKVVSREQSLVITEQYSKYLIEENLNRPFGPGIMHESVLYFILYLGFSDCTIFGWDLGNKNNNTINRFYENKKGYKLFSSFFHKCFPTIYNKYFIRIENKIREYLYLVGFKNIILNNPGIAKNEANTIAKTSYNFYKFFKSKKLNINIVSDISLLDNRIPREDFNNYKK